MIINDLDGYYIVFDTKNWNTELDTLEKYIILYCVIMGKEIESSTIKTADMILASCVVAIIIVSAVWCCRTCFKPEVQPIRIEITASDSLKMANYLSKEQADSLITIVKRHERELAERYQYALEQKWIKISTYRLALS